MGKMKFGSSIFMTVNFSVIVLAASLSFGGCKYHYTDNDLFNFDTKNPETKLIKEQNFKVKKNVYVRADVGNIVSESWDKNEVYIKISGNDGALRKLNFDILEKSDYIEVSAKSKSNFLNNVNVRIEIKMPKSCENKLNTSGGDVTVKNFNSSNLIKTSGGNLYVYNITGNLNGRTSGGNVILKNSDGAIDIETSGGNIEAQKVTGDLKLVTSGGNVSIKSKDSKILAETSGGEIDLEYSGINKEINLTTMGGNISITVPENFAAYADLETSGGSVNLGLTPSKTDKNDEDVFRGSFNNGTTTLKARTSGGNITLQTSK